MTIHSTDGPTVPLKKCEIFTETGSKAAPSKRKADMGKTSPAWVRRTHLCILKSLFVYSRSYPVLSRGPCGLLGPYPGFYARAQKQRCRATSASKVDARTRAALRSPVDCGNCIDLHFPDAYHEPELNADGAYSHQRWESSPSGPALLLNAHMAGVLIFRR